MPEPVEIGELRGEHPRCRAKRIRLELLGAGPAWDADARLEQQPRGQALGPCPPSIVILGRVNLSRALHAAVLAPLYRAYEARLRRQIPTDGAVSHLGVILDGNRRWGASSTVDLASAYQAGGKKILSLVDWCDEAYVSYVTLWLLSTDNLRRADAELAPIYTAIADTLDQLRARPSTRVLHVGAADQLPAEVARHLKQVESDTKGRTGITVNMAVAYGGKQEITDALKSWLTGHSSSDVTLDELALQLTPEELEPHTYMAGQPHLDLIIRTSGEQRLSGFMLWHSTYAELYFCEALWPDFRRIDFWRALRSYASRQRRFGR